MTKTTTRQHERHQHIKDIISLYDSFPRHSCGETLSLAFDLGWSPPLVAICPSQELERRAIRYLRQQV